MAPTLAKARAAGADLLLLQLHAGPTALLLKAAASMGLGLPVVSGSAISQPSTAALLEPREMAHVCAETAAAPVAADTPGMRRFLDEYRHAFGGDPDAYAVAQYDGTMMVLQALAQGAKDAADVTRALATGDYQGLAMRYRSDGRGDMAHTVAIVCYDGASRVPTVVRHYDFASGPG
jgi:branched-chain amino acid transport system substrate-binding protein